MQYFRFETGIGNGNVEKFCYYGIKYCVLCIGCFAVPAVNEIKTL